jgi:hypothetical protein
MTRSRSHLQMANFYINDPDWGRMFVRICPYFPFSARICLNHHHWLGKAMSGINDNYLDVQQDILETFIDRGQLRKAPLSSSAYCRQPWAYSPRPWCSSSSWAPAHGQNIRFVEGNRTAEH